MASIEDNGINHRKVQVMSSSNKPCETNRLFLKKKKKKKCHYMNRRRDAHGFQEINKPKKSCGAYNSSFGCWLFFFHPTNIDHILNSQRSCCCWRDNCKRMVSNFLTHHKHTLEYNLICQKYWEEKSKKGEGELWSYTHVYQEIHT